MHHYASVMLFNSFPHDTHIIRVSVCVSCMYMVELSLTSPLDWLKVFVGKQYHYCLTHFVIHRLELPKSRYPSDPFRGFLS